MITMHVLSINPLTCPMCSYVMPAAMSPDDPGRKGPQPGHFCVCGRCTAILVMDADGHSLRLPNVSEAKLIFSRPDLRLQLALFQSAVRQAQAILRARSN